jgi:hypothetical protein
VKRIAIGAGVVVQGGFRVSGRAQDNPLTIAGADRKTSTLLGTYEEAWTTQNGVADNEKWKYGAVNVLSDAVVYIDNLTSLNPRAYHFSGYARQSVLHVLRCNLLDTRPGQRNNSDGFVGAAGSSITDCFISTGDDAIKIYSDMTIRGVTIEQHRNGAPIQFGWGDEDGRAKARIEGLTIRGVDAAGRYNMAPFTWERGRGGVREVTVQGLNVEISGQLYDEASKQWIRLGLCELKPEACTLNMALTNANIGALGLGVQHTRGVILRDGRPLKK